MNAPKNCLLKWEVLKKVSIVKVLSCSNQHALLPGAFTEGSIPWHCQLKSPEDLRAIIKCYPALYCLHSSFLHR